MEAKHFIFTYGGPCMGTVLVPVHFVGDAIEECAEYCPALEILGAAAAACREIVEFMLEGRDA